MEKWQSLGNDYLVAEEGDFPWEPTPARVKILCDRNFGIGSDGLLLVGPPSGAEAVASLRIFNPDGSEAELSGNGARQAALYLRQSGRTSTDRFGIETRAGIVEPTILPDGNVRMDMGVASQASSEQFPDGPADGRGRLDAGGQSWEYSFHSIGNPQCAIAVEEGLEELDLSRVGPEIENHALFPLRTNVSFWSFEDRDAEPTVIRARIFERGVGETLSSGTGACGAALAALGAGDSSPVLVRLDGGDLLVSVDADRSVVLTGWGERVFTAELSPSFLESLAAEALRPSPGAHP